METITVAADGTPSLSLPTEIVFRDAEGIRPAAPFFELHASWTDAAGVRQSGPVTRERLTEWGASLDKLLFDVQLVNLKAFHYTQKDGDRVEARAKVRASDHRRTPLLAKSPDNTENPLIPSGTSLPFGTFQVLLPTAALPELRVRVTPPAGLTYGPADLNARINALDIDYQFLGGFPNREWAGFTLPTAQLVLNPNAAWARWVQDLATLPPFGGNDGRNTPGSLLAAPYEKIPWDTEGRILSRSLGLLDDVSDGVLTATLEIAGNSLVATARIAVGPPDYAPASRTPVSLADNLTDREGRAATRATSLSIQEMREIVLDIFERAFETSELIHRDYQNARSASTNRSTQAGLGGSSPFDNEDVVAMLWPVPARADVVDQKSNPMALSADGERKHRRYATLEYLEDRFRENPALFDQWLRRPADPNPFFDRRMPALMRGSDGRPFHLTRWQWELIRRWIAALRAEAPAAGAPAPSAAVTPPGSAT